MRAGRGQSRAGSRGVVRRRVRVGHEPRQVASFAGRLWVSVFGDDAVAVAVADPRTGSVIRRTRVCDGPQGLAGVGGRLWVACTDADRVVALDPDGTVARRIALQGAPDGVARAPGGVAVSLQDGPSVATLDPGSGRVLTRRRLGSGFLSDANVDLVRAGGRMWVSWFDGGVLYRLPG